MDPTAPEDAEEKEELGDPTAPEDVKEESGDPTAPEDVGNTRWTTPRRPTTRRRRFGGGGGIRSRVTLLVLTGDPHGRRGVINRTGVWELSTVLTGDPHGRRGVVDRGTRTTTRVHLVLSSTPVRSSFSWRRHPPRPPVRSSISRLLVHGRCCGPLCGLCGRLSRVASFTGGWRGRRGWGGGGGEICEREDGGGGREAEERGERK